MQEFKQTDLYKRYVSVVVEVDKNGVPKPLYIKWDNGVYYKIDRILEKRNAMSVVGGGGILYLVRINDKERKLFFERTRWFIESYNP